MKKKKGFTLVELLAVIVILAIILVIAVPQIMDTIDSARSASLESSAKMVAAQVENQHTVSQTLGTNFSSSGDCTTAKWAGLNDKDYESCTYSIDSNGKASVTLVGKGKFEGKSICDGTRTSAKVTEESCGLVCAAGTTKVVKSVTPVMPYEVENAESCVSFFTGRVPSDILTQEMIDAYNKICNGEVVNNKSFSDFIEEGISYNLSTEQELIENKVIKGTIEEVCTTPEICFAFDEGAITGYDASCGTDVVIPSTIGGVNVTAIGDYAFTSNGAEVAVLSSDKDYLVDYLHNSNDYEVTPIAALAVEGLGVTSVFIPEGITTIGESAFESNLIEELDLPSTINTIGWWAFVSNPLKSVNLKNQSAEIGDGAFGCLENIDHNIPTTYDDTDYCS